MYTMGKQANCVHFSRFATELLAIVLVFGVHNSIVLLVLLAIKTEEVL